MKKNQQILLRILTFSILLLFAALPVFAQNVVTGKILNVDGIGISGVTVTVKGTQIRTQSDANGNYTINAPSPNSTLVFSSVSFVSQEIIANNAGSVTMAISNASLDEIIVVAYGTRKKSDLTGSVVAVTTKDFQKGNINSAEQLLQGKVAGLEITTGGGAAGGGSKIRIRGTASLNASNDPLIVIDGMPVEGNGVAGSANLLATINPNDIESMTVLKDASAAALYGSRATNGVIIITTKKAGSKKFRFNYNTRFSVGEVVNRVDVLNADQIRSIVNEKGNATFKGFLGTANTDWQDQIYQKAIGFDNTISASGTAQLGKFALPLRASIGYLTQEGNLKTNKFDRITGSLNLSPKFLDNHLSVNVNAKFSNTDTRFADEGAIGSAVGFDPTQPVFSGNNKFGGYYEWIAPGGNTLNVLAPRNPLGLLQQRQNNSDVNRLIGNVQLDYKMHFLPDLHLLVNLGVDQATGKGSDIIDSASAISTLAFLGRGRKSIYNQEKRSKIADVQLFYEKDLESIKSKIDVLVGHSYQEYFTDDIINYAFFQNGTVDTTTVRPPRFFTDRNGFAIDSYLGRLNYSYNDKYLVTASIRRDASSKFAEGNRVGYFPAVAVAWKMREDFFKNSQKLSELKLRFGIGETGQQDGIGSYEYLPRYSFADNSARYQFGDAFVDVLRPAAYDPTIKWETTLTTNLGLDFGFFSNRITGSVDVYEKKTRDLLSIVDIPSGANFNVQLLKNVGNLENRGAELAMNFIPVQSKTWNWNFGFNVAYNETEITKLIDYTDPSFKGLPVGGISGGTGNNIGRFNVGNAPYVFYVKKQVYDNSGRPIQGLYEDLNRDGIASVTDDNDKYFYKKPAPDAIYGFNTSVSYKQVSLGLAGHGMIGNYLYNNFASNNGTERNILNPVQHLGNASTSYLETGFTNNTYLSDYYIENASFFRLDNINFGYDLGKIAKGKASMRLNANIQNVFVVTKYSGADPESASSTGVDNNIYPRPRIYNIGASIDF